MLKGLGPLSSIIFFLHTYNSYKYNTICIIFGILGPRFDLHMPFLKNTMKLLSNSITNAECTHINTTVDWKAFKFAKRIIKLCLKSYKNTCINEHYIQVSWGGIWYNTTFKLVSVLSNKQLTCSSNVPVTICTHRNRARTVGLLLHLPYRSTDLQ